MATTYILKERLWVGLFLLFICLVVAHDVHSAWFVQEAYLAAHPPEPGAPYYSLFREAPTHIPEAYRVAVPAAGVFAMRVLKIKDPATVAGLFDFVSGSLACYLFYCVALEHLPKTFAMATKRLLVIALFLAFLQFPMAWVVPWQRPETLPSALFLAATLFALQHLERSKRWIVFILVLTVIQAFVRTDIPLVLGLALILFCFIPAPTGRLAPRGLLFTLGGLIMLIGAGVQAYLQIVRFPHLHYWPGTPLIQLSTNLRSPHLLFIVAIALLPFLTVTALLVITRHKLDSIDTIVLLSSGLYLLLFFTLGIIGEVRLYVPFLLALSTISAKFFASVLETDFAEKVRSAPDRPLNNFKRSF